MAWCRGGLELYGFYARGFVDGSGHGWSVGDLRGEDVSGVGLWAVCGKWPGVCKIVIGLLYLGGRGGNLSTLPLPEMSGCSVRLMGR